jgi:hypothetical protein
MDTIVQITGELNDVSLVRRLSTKVLDSPRLSRNLSLSHVKYPCQVALHAGEARRLTSRIGDQFYGAAPRVEPPNLTPKIKKFSVAVYVANNCSGSTPELDGNYLCATDILGHIPRSHAGINDA